MRKLILVLCWLLQNNIQAQTKVDLRTQGKAVDFSQAASTQPAKKGTTLPSTCVAGEVFFKTDATAGQNLYLCASSNTWTQGNAGTVTHTAGALATGKIVVGNGSGDSKTTGVGIDGSNNISTSGTLSTTGVASPSLALNGSSSGTVTQTAAGAAGTWNFTWPTGAGSSLTFLQTDGSGVATWANPAFDQILGFLAATQLPAVAARTDQSNSYTGGVQDFSTAAATVPQRKGSSDPGTCGVGEQFYNTTSNKLKLCTNQDTWTDYSPTGLLGTVTHTAGNLTGGKVVVGNGTADEKVTGVSIDSSDNISTSGSLTTTGSGSGSLALKGSTSGTFTQTVAAAAGTWTLTWPSNAGANGQVLQTNGSGVATWATAAASGSGAPNYTQSFSSVTSVTVTHGLGTNNLILACLDANDKYLEPASWSIGQSAPFDVSVTFNSAQTGRCVVNGTGSAKYATTFASQTSISIAGTTHNLGTADLDVQCYDASSTRRRIEPDTVTIDPATKDVTVTFFAPQSGRCVVM